MNIIERYEKNIKEVREFVEQHLKKEIPKEGFWRKLVEIDSDAITAFVGSFYKGLHLETGITLQFLEQIVTLQLAIPDTSFRLKVSYRDDPVEVMRLRSDYLPEKLLNLLKSVGQQRNYMESWYLLRERGYTLTLKNGKEEHILTPEDLIEIFSPNGEFEDLTHIIGRYELPQIYTPILKRLEIALRSTAYILSDERYSELFKNEATQALLQFSPQYERERQRQNKEHAWKQVRYRVEHYNQPSLAILQMVLLQPSVEEAQKLISLLASNEVKELLSDANFEDVLATNQEWTPDYLFSLISQSSNYLETIQDLYALFQQRVRLKEVLQLMLRSCWDKAKINDFKIWNRLVNLSDEQLNRFRETYTFILAGIKAHSNSAADLFETKIIEKVLFLSQYEPEELIHYKKVLQRLSNKSEPDLLELSSTKITEIISLRSETPTLMLEETLLLSEYRIQGEGLEDASRLFLRAVSPNEKEDIHYILEVIKISLQKMYTGHSWTVAEMSKLSAQCEVLIERKQIHFHALMNSLLEMAFTKPQIRRLMELILLVPTNDILQVRGSIELVMWAICELKHEECFDRLRSLIPNAKLWRVPLVLNLVNHFNKEGKEKLTKFNKGVKFPKKHAEVSEYMGRTEGVVVETGHFDQLWEVATILFADKEIFSSQADAFLTIELLFRLIEEDYQLAPFGVAQDRVLYLKKLLHNTQQKEKKDEFELAFSAWDEELVQELTPIEREVYAKRGEELFRKWPKALERYALLKKQLRRNAPGEKPHFSNDEELNYYLYLLNTENNQADQVIKWYVSIAFHLSHFGGEAFLKKYLLRVTNNLRPAHSHVFHDALLWHEYIHRVSQADLKAIMSTVSNSEEHTEFHTNLASYSFSRDELASDDNPITSLRELTKRVSAMRANIQLKDFPESFAPLLEAPGFNFEALQEMKHSPRFKELSEGKLDKDQPFPATVRYFASRPLPEAVREGLEIHIAERKERSGKATTLFKKLQSILESNRKLPSIKDVKLNDLMEFVPPQIESAVIQALVEAKVEMGDVVKVEIYNKSDPRGWVVGNWTKSCNPFGTFLASDAMFNQGMQAFTVSYNDRVITHSIIIDGKNTQTGEKVVILSNIEHDIQNYADRMPAVGRAIEVFWTEFTKLPVKIGTGYIDLIPANAALEENIYESVIPNNDPDPKGTHIYDLPKVSENFHAKDMMMFSNVSLQDVKKIAQIEAKIYPENMRLGEASIRQIVEQSRNNQLPGSATSFLLRKGKNVVGYALFGPGESEVNKRERVAYVYDLAILPEYQGQGLAWPMMKRVAESCLAYGVALEVHARKSTSYKMLMHSSVQSWLKEKGFSITHNELKKKHLGDEDFYFMRLEPPNLPKKRELELRRNQRMRTWFTSEQSA